MSEKMYVKPARKGQILRDPVTKQELPAAGGWVPKSRFWMRRLDPRHGDVVEAKPPKREESQGEKDRKASAEAKAKAEAEKAAKAAKKAEADKAKASNQTKTQAKE